MMNVSCKFYIQFAQFYAVFSFPGKMRVLHFIRKSFAVLRAVDI